MPSIMLKNIAAGTANAVNGLNFEDIPPGGALLSLYATTAVAAGTVGLKVGSEDFLVDAQVNIESAADVIDTDRDQVLFQEPVPEGKLFISVGAQVGNILAVLEYVAA
jgi:hypothetical protein